MQMWVSGNKWIPLISKNEDLEGTVLKLFEESDVVVDPSNVEDCHWVTIKTSKKAINKLSRRKDANKIRRMKKNLKKTKIILSWNKNFGLY